MFKHANKIIIGTNQFAKSFTIAYVLMYIVTQYFNVNLVD